MRNVSFVVRYKILPGLDNSLNRREGVLCLHGITSRIKLRTCQSYVSTCIVLQCMFAVNKSFSFLFLFMSFF